MIIIVNNHYFHDCDLLNLFNFIRNYKKNVILYTLYPKLYKRVIIYEDDIKLFNKLKNIPKYYGKECSTKKIFGDIGKEYNYKDLYCNMNELNYINYNHVKLNLKSDYLIFKYCDKYYEKIDEFIEYKTKYNLGEYYKKKLYLDFYDFKEEIKKYIPIYDFEKHILKIIKIEIFNLEKNIVSNKKNYKIDHDDKSNNIVNNIVSNIDISKITDSLKENYNSEIILEKLYIPITQSNFCEELKDGYCIGINMMIKRHHDRILHLEKFPVNFGSMREMYDRCYHGINEIGFDSYTQDNIYGKYNIVIPLFINKHNFTVSKKLLYWIFNKMDYTIDQLYVLLFDMAYLLVNILINNNFNNKCKKEIEIFFMFWITCYKLKEKNIKIKMNKKNIKMLFGRMLVNNFEFNKDLLNEYIAMKYILPERENFMYYLNLLKILFDKININNLMSELCRNYSILNGELSDNILEVLKKEYYLKNK
jgi:hypothetical protein